jgi:hypothetical protein
MSKKTGKKLVLVVHPDQLKTKGQQDAFVDKAADKMLDLIDENRRAAGKPPLK